MHHLEESIAEWRSRMQTAPNIGPDALDELETHLREIVELQVRSGVDEPEAFQRAVAELGSTSTVATEFQKLKSPVWLPVKVAAVLMGLAAILELSSVLAMRWAKADHLLIAHVLVLGLGHVAALLQGLLGICFVCQRCWTDFSSRRLESLSHSVRGFADMAAWLIALGIVMGMVWSKMHWGAFWSWYPKEIGSLCILLWLVGYSGARRFRQVTPRGLLTSSVLGINVVFLGLLMPDLIPSDLHSYGMPSYGPLVVAEALGLLFFLIGLAPAGWLRLRRNEA